MTSHAAAIDRQVLADSLKRCGPWYCTDDDDTLVSHARAQARAIEQEAAHVGDDLLAYQRAVRRVDRHCLTPPSIDEYGLRGAMRRMTCEHWWRRQLRRLNARRLEQRERVLGRVHDRAGIYVSQRGFAQRRAQISRNRELLAGLVATNQHGQEYTLAELAELGLANPDNRRAELMLRIAQTEIEATRLGHVGVFLTITCPSRFHAVHKGLAKVNRKFDGTDPREAQAYLQKMWSRARAKLGRKGLGIYGIRVVEPHHDGCPHWHLLLWCHPQWVGAVCGLLRGYALADNPEEVANDETVRFDAELIDPAKGSAAAYVAKYICKNINGKQHARGSVEGDHLDHYGHDLTTSAPRIEAWAATWGIRQFQFFGLPSVTVWREVRRLKADADVEAWEEATRPEPEAAAILGELRRACLGNQWAEFLRIMGGPMTKRDDQPVRPWRVVRSGSLDEATGEIVGEYVGRYGDQVETTWGLVVTSAVGEAEYLTRLYRWDIERAAAVGFDLEQLREGEADAPRTGVNNCTPQEPSTEKCDPQSVFAPWERRVHASLLSMMPPLYESEVTEIRRKTAIDLWHYEVESIERRERAAERRRWAEYKAQADDMFITLLAQGEITEAEALEGLRA